MEPITIDGRKVGGNSPCYIIAEIGSNFDGSLEKAKYMIDLAKECGADAVKFQSFRAEDIVSEKGFRSLKVAFQSAWKKPVIEVYRDAELPTQWNEELMAHAKKKGITYFSTPYDKKNADYLDKIGVLAFKIGSGDITWLEMIKYISGKKKPVIIGCGASTVEEIGEAIEAIRSEGNDEIVLLQCVTNYPSSFKNANIKAMKSLGERYKVLYGYSDHSPGHIVPLGAVALGACVIEKHFTYDKKALGPDHPFAMDPSDFKEMVKAIRLLESGLGDKKEVYDEEKETVVIQRRCLRASKSLDAGHVVKGEDIEVLRPAPLDSIYPKHKESLIGKKLKRSLEKGDYFKKADF